MINKYLVFFPLAALMVGAALGIHSAAQSATPAPNAKLTNGMSSYVQAGQQSLVSGTEATNLTDVELRSLMNESLNTNLAAQLWHRQGLGRSLSSHGDKMATELLVLESLRAGRTDEAIRQLEKGLDIDVIIVSTDLRAADAISFKPTPEGLRALRWARDYRLKFPHKSGDTATDEGVAYGLSYVDKK